MSAAGRCSSGATYISSAEGKLLSVHLSPEVALRISVEIQSRARKHSGTGRDQEIGGLLLGNVRQSSESLVISVEGLEVVSISHIRGESWAPAERDRKRLVTVLKKFRTRGSEKPAVVGWFRTHTRPGLYLDNRDFELVKSFFPDPSCVALLIRPDPSNPMAGFFFWEAGEMQRSQPYHSFPFNDLLLASAATTVASPVAAKAVHPGVPAKRARVSLAKPLANSGSWRKKAVLIAPVAAGLAFGVFWDPQPLVRARQVDLAKIISSVKDEP
ncbi:MAG: hypothetical protein H7Y20_00095, partial [Bryobacteraceae bacterium]|nr:hypothetical protein [Bryobacteraceae bacterium]